MMPQPGASEWPNDKQKTALQNFCKEIWDDYLRPFETEKNTSQIRLDDLCASFGKHVGGQPEANPHDMTQTARHLMMFFSNYTHMGYPALMELFRDPQPRLSGKEDIHGYFTLHQAAKVLAEVCHVTSALLIRHDRGMEEFTADHKKELRELFQQQKKVVDAISQRLEAGFSRGDCSKQILRAFKKGKPIDDLLDAPNPAKTQLKGEV